MRYQSHLVYTNKNHAKQYEHAQTMTQHKDIHYAAHITYILVIKLL